MHTHTTVELKDGLVHLVNTKAIGLETVSTFPATGNTATKQTKGIFHPLPLREDATSRAYFGSGKTDKP